MPINFYELEKGGGPRCFNCDSSLLVFSCEKIATRPRIPPSFLMAHTANKMGCDCIPYFACIEHRPGGLMGEELLIKVIHLEVYFLVSQSPPRHESTCH